jgi:hypothetical protein
MAHPPERIVCLIRGAVETSGRIRALRRASIGIAAAAARRDAAPSVRDGRTRGIPAPLIAQPEPDAPMGGHPARRGVSGRDWQAAP